MPLDFPTVVRDIDEARRAFQALRKELVFEINNPSNNQILAYDSTLEQFTNQDVGTVTGITGSYQTWDATGSGGGTSTASGADTMTWDSADSTIVITLSESGGDNIDLVVDESNLSVPGTSLTGFTENLIAIGSSAGGLEHDTWGINTHLYTSATREIRLTGDSSGSPHIVAPDATNIEIAFNSGSNGEVYIVNDDVSGIANLKVEGDLTVEGYDVTVGAGGAVDSTITFDGSSNDLELKWDESAGAFIWSLGATERLRYTFSSQTLALGSGAEAIDPIINFKGVTGTGVLKYDESASSLSFDRDFVLSGKGATAGILRLGDGSNTTDPQLKFDGTNNEVLFTWDESAADLNVTFNGGGIRYKFEEETLTLGNGSSLADPKITFAGQNNSATYTYDESADVLQIDSVFRFQNAGSVSSTQAGGVFFEGTTNNELQVYNGTAWRTIIDANLTSLASGEILKFDGTDWVNNTLAEAGISTGNVKTVITSPASQTITFGVDDELDLTEGTGILIDNTTTGNIVTVALDTPVTVSNGGTGTTILEDGGVLLGSGTGAITAMSVLADGSIIVGDGATDPVALAAFTSSTGTLKHESGGLESDVSSGDGFVEIKGGSTTVIKSNLAGTTAPGANDDSGSGYAVGSIWIDTTNDKSYFCVDATSTAAVWNDLTSGGGGGAPTDATYITQTADGTLSAEQALSSLSTGIMEVTTTTGVVSSFVPTEDKLLVGAASGRMESESLLTYVSGTKTLTMGDATKLILNIGGNDVDTLDVGAKSDGAGAKNVATWRGNIGTGSGDATQKVRHTFLVENSTTANEEAGYLDFGWTDATATTEDADFEVWLKDNGATPVVKMTLDVDSGLTLVDGLTVSSLSANAIMVTGAGGAVSTTPNPLQDGLGGTGAALTIAANDVIYGSGSGTIGNQPMGSFTALTGPAATDKLLIDDSGTLKHIEVQELPGAVTGRCMLMSVKPEDETGVVVSGGTYNPTGNRVFDSHLFTDATIDGTDYTIWLLWQVPQFITAPSGTFTLVSYCACGTGSLVYDYDVKWQSTDEDLGVTTVAFTTQPSQGTTVAGDADRVTTAMTGGTTPSAGNLIVMEINLLGTGTTNWTLNQDAWWWFDLIWTAT
jgi:hypothetical protein